MLKRILFFSLLRCVFCDERASLSTLEGAHALKIPFCRRGHGQMVRFIYNYYSGNPTKFS
jgi:hypothetical protein